MNYFVYFLLSLKDNGYYIGCTSQIPKERLFNYHNKGKVKSTKPRIPLELIYVEVYNDKNIAFKREFYLKHPKGYKEKLEIVNLIKNTEKENLPIIIQKY
jgi:putative endonuclease